MPFDPIRAIRSLTDLARAHSLASRLTEHAYDDRTGRVLKAALITEYARPFTSQDDGSSALQLGDLIDVPSPLDVDTHLSLIDGARMLSRAVSEGANMPWEERVLLLDNLDISTVRDLIFRLRRSLALKLYPDAGSDPQLLEQLIGPAGSAQS